MMSLEVIRRMNNEIAAEAAKTNKRPYVPASPDERNLLRHIPGLGCFVPDGWRKTEAEWFVDKSGLGRAYGPALTIDRFRRALRRYILANPEHGYAITEEGPFQLFVTAFQRIG
jgi:hypothetical protein